MIINRNSILKRLQKISLSLLILIIIEIVLFSLFIIVFLWGLPFIFDFDKGKFNDNIDKTLIIFLALDIFIPFILFGLEISIFVLLILIVVITSKYKNDDLKIHKLYLKWLPALILYSISITFGILKFFEVPIVLDFIFGIGAEILILVVSILSLIWINKEFRTNLTEV
ncbi:hypothetical protein BCF59_0314 [Mycoplasmopsis mustelae]|uniref:Uncharacterized protein n=1 Tax=Mycoplasmopsis mustelae TaxID=171289 RepID=A0A4R7UEP9_9BACT|nr:hypothetical protein [Mycoplasmopsis mustelae]TDV24353.1 hypothetical protein BCF59_0314 [Mycoplasmopsis mustelae]